MIRSSQKKEEEKIKKIIIILILALSFVSLLPALTSPAHAFTCPTSSASGKIEGCVVSYDYGSPVPNQYVVIITCGGYQITDYAITDSNGHFSFAETLPNGSACIIANKSYVLSVNGATPVTSADGCYPLPSPCKVLGKDAYDPMWGQWVGDITTDNTGYASAAIQISPAKTVMVAAAAMYSNTQWSTLHFQMSQSADVSIGVSASIGAASSIQAGFSNNFGVTSTNAFDEPPVHADYFGLPYYAIGYYCAGSSSESFYGWSCSQGLQNAGVTIPVGGYHWQPYQRVEYLNPNTLSTGSYLDCNILPSAAPFGPSSTHTVGQTSSLGFTWGATFWGITASLSYTTTYTSTTSDTTGITINYTNGPNLIFRYYPASGTCDKPIWGSELHVWDMSTPPDYSLTASPSSLSAQTGSSWSKQTTASVQASWGWALPVGLTASSDDPNLSLSLNPTSVNPMGGTATSTLTVNDFATSDCGSFSIWVVGSSTTNRWTSISLTISPIDFCFFTNKNAVDVAHSAGDCPIITLTSNTSTNIALSANLPTGLSALFGLASVPVGAGGTAQTNVCFAASSTLNIGTYSGTLTATSGNIVHTIPISINYIGDYSLAVSSSTVYASPGTSAADQLTGFSNYGFSGYVNFYTQSSGGITASISANPMLIPVGYGGSSSTSMSITVPSTTPVGTYSLTIQGWYQGPHAWQLTHSITITVSVSTPCSGCGGGGGGGGPPRPMIPKSIN